MKAKQALTVSIFLFLCSVSSVLCSISEEDAEYAELRKRMVKNQLKARDITDKRVLEAMGKVPRHLFVNEANKHLAYGDYPLPIGEGQTISQPYIVALMTQLLDLKGGEKVLEIGTGSGYQAAVLAHLTDKVFSVEILPRLAERALTILERLGYDHVRIKQGDGYAGWKEEAPFDAMIVTCAASRVPPELFKQLKEGGRMVLPLGSPQTYQVLTLVTKKGGKPKHKKVLDVRFVPMTGKAQEVP